MPNISTGFASRISYYSGSILWYCKNCLSDISWRWDVCYCQWLWSLGLALSSTVDVIITVSLFVLLWQSRARSLRLEKIAHDIPRILKQFLTASTVSLMHLFCTLWNSGPWLRAPFNLSQLSQPWTRNSIATIIAMITVRCLSRSYSHLLTYLVVARGATQFDLFGALLCHRKA